MSGWHLVVVIVVVTVGACIQGSVGFGYGMFAGPIIAILQPRLVPGPMLVCALGLTLAVAHRERRSIEFKQIRWALVGRVPGTVVGAAAVAVLPISGLSIVFAIVVLVAVGISLAGWKLAPTTPTLLGAGAVSGFMGTVGSIGGPPMAMVYQRHPGASLRGVLAGFFSIGTMMSIVALVLVGKFGLAEIRDGLVLLPAMAVGFLASRVTAPVLDRGRTRGAVLVISAVSSIVLLAQQLL